MEIMKIGKEKQLWFWVKWDIFGNELLQISLF
jgi:hypothetical protein